MKEALNEIIQEIININFSSFLLCLFILYIFIIVFNRLYLRGAEFDNVAHRGCQASRPSGTNAYKLEVDVSVKITNPISNTEVGISKISHRVTQAVEHTLSKKSEQYVRQTNYSPHNHPTPNTPTQTSNYK
ncbi:MAG: hypothetical protein H3C45_11700 [Bacteroidia bacterium]|nr:hypothetical protein [Bacteroidia bacterium]